MTIELGMERDIDNWMNLVEKVKDSFPGLETREALNEHKNTVLDFMGRASAICAKEQGKIVGTLLFSKECNELCFLAVDTEYRRQHIAEKMVSLDHGTAGQSGRSRQHCHCHRAQSGCDEAGGLAH